MSKSIFMHTVASVSNKATIELRAMDGQQAADFEGKLRDINPDEPITCNVEIAQQYPLGTAFGVNSDFFWFTPTGYSIGDFFPMVNDFQLKSDEHKASSDMWSDFKTFANKPEPHKTVEKKETEATSSPTFFDKILKMYPCPQIEKSDFFIKPSQWKILLRNVLLSKNTLLTGPSGCGKTELVKAMGRILGLPVTVIHTNTLTDPEQLTGTMRMTAGDVYFDYAAFALAIQKPGIVLLDEINRANNSVTNALLGCLDNSRSLMISMAGANEKRTIHVNKDCTIIATANVGHEFSGVFKFDKALRSRFFPMEMDHPETEMEVSILTHKCKIDTTQARTISNIAQNIRSGYKEKVIHTDISTRETLEIAELVEQGMSIGEAFEARVLPLYESDGTENDERETVKNWVVAYA